MSRQLRLLVLQPTPFCNLDCCYCYLPGRKERNRMDLATVSTVGEAVFGSGLCGDHLEVMWHAGEPLMVPRTWYEAAFARLEARRPLGLGLRHVMQTNATLIDDAWCALFLRYNVRLGV